MILKALKKCLFISLIWGAMGSVCLGQKSALVLESAIDGVSKLVLNSWKNALVAKEYNVEILGLGTLDDTLFLSPYSIVVVPSAFAFLTEKHASNLISFIKRGGSIYIQGEYECSLPTNQAYQRIVNSLGANFRWSTTLTGALDPVAINGTYRDTSEKSVFIQGVWYGCGGIGTNIERVVSYGGAGIGFSYCPENSNYGMAICITDQDWLRQIPESKFLLNLITHLQSRSLCKCTKNKPKAFDQQNLVICQNEPYEIKPNIRASSYEWGPLITTPSIVVYSKGVYKLRFIVDYCSYTDSIAILDRDCNSSLEMPNLFTPNNDGVNDQFSPIQAVNIESYDLQIFNRWGTKVYHSKQVTDKWTAQQHSDGVYYYYVTYTDPAGRRKNLKGIVEVIR